ncbi:hypothetical protein BJH93_11665 [Kocuria polaris]|nr:hypothetical protein [Kocuria polaris]
MTASIAIAIGVLVLAAAAVSTASTSFGWFAYAPLSESGYLPDVVLVSRTTILLEVVGLICLLVGAFTLGLWRGRRAVGR